MDTIGLKARLTEQGSFVTALEAADSSALISFASQFGKPAFTHGRPPRPVITEVRPRPHFDPASFAGTDEFGLHTDLSWMQDDEIPSLMFLLCVRPEAAGGGASLQVDGWKVWDSVSERCRAELQARSVRMRSHRDSISITYREAPLVRIVGGKPLIRFRRDLLEGEVPECVEEFGAAADKLVTRFRLEAGQVVVMDNTRMLHGRDSLNAGLESDRLLLRIHVK